MRLLRFHLLLAVVCADFAGQAFAVPVITATKDDNTAAGVRKFPGNTINYTITIQNTGDATATNVLFTDPDPANTTFVSVNSTPLARNDAYGTVGNVQISVPAANGLLVNDNDPDGIGAAPTVTAVNTAGTQGTVSFNADGSFSFNPTAGFEGATTFTYTLTDNEGSTDTGTVTVTITGSIWFIQNGGAAGDGRLSTPFNSIAAFQALNDGVGTHPAAGDNIFLYENAAAYVGTVTLLNNQKLIGQDATADLATITGLAQPSFATNAYPVMNSGNANTTTLTTSVAATNVINLAVGANATIRGLGFGSTTGAAIASGASFGTLTSSDVSKTGPGQALALTAGTLAATFNTLSSTSSVSAVSLTNVAGSLTAAAGAISGATGDDFFVSGGAASITYPGTITNTAGRSVNISGKTGGTVLFSGAISDTGTGISLTTNTGATINFTGGLNLSTGANAAFTATGGGTVSATQNNTTIVNTITTTSGAALNVASTTIGASGLTFRSIASGAGANVGISLVNTGTAAGDGGLTVTGTGTAGSGGTISGKTGANGSTTAGIAINLENTKNPSFTRVQLNDHQNFAIRASDVNGFTLQNSVINGNNGNDAGSDEEAIFFLNCSGTITVASNSISGGFEDNMGVLYNSGTADTAIYNVTANIFTDLQSGNNALVKLTTTTAASASSNVTFNFGSPTNAALGNTFDNSANQNPLPPPDTQWFGDGILVTFEGPFQHTINIDNNTFFELFQGIDYAANFSADVDGRIYNNTITYTEGVGAIAFGTGSSSTSSMLFQLLIEDNDIGGLGNDSGSRLGSGIVGDFRGAETARVTIHQNVVRDTEVNPINIISQMTLAQDGDTHLRITNNTIASIDDDAGAGAGVIPGINVTTNAATNGDIFLTITGNDSSSINEAEILVRQATLNNTYSLEDFAGSGTVAAQVEAYLVAQNPGTTARVRTGGSVVNYSTMNLNNTNTPAPFSPLLFAPGGVSGTEGVAPVDAGLQPGTSAGGETLVEKASTRTVQVETSVLPGIVRALKKAELDALVASALDRWATTGLTGEQLATLGRLKFEVADLPGWYLGEANGDRIRVDNNAGGNGWFIGGAPEDDALFANVVSPTRRYTDPASAPAGRIDLLTAILHEMGHSLGLCDSYLEKDRDSLMSGFLTKGERRLPTRRDAAAARILGGAPHLHPHFLGTPLAIGDLPAGKTVTITYVVTINAGTTAISTSNQGTVSGSNIANKLTNDPQTGAADDATVSPIHQPPVVTNVAVATNEEATLTFTAANFTGSYTDPNSDALATVRITSLPSNGVLKIGAATVAAVPTDVAIASIGTLTFVPNPNYNGPDSFGWNGSDGTLFATSGALVNITVNAVNDKPTFTAANPPTVMEDPGAQTVVGWVTNFNPGPPNEASQTVLAYAVSNVSSAALFSVLPAVANNGNLTYTLAANASGTSTFQVRVQDSGGVTNSGVDTSDPQTFTITVTAVNDLPVITGQNVVSTPEETARAIVLGDLTVTDVESPYPAGYTLTVLDGANYTRTGNTITPVTNFNGPLSVRVTVTDPGGATSDPFILTVTVTPINDNPLAVADTISRYPTQSTKVRETAILANDTDVDGDILVITSVTSPSPNGATVTRSGGYVFYAPAAGFTGADTFTYLLSDGQGGTATGTVNVQIVVDDAESSNKTRIQSEPAPGGGTQVRVTFAGIPGRTYRVQTTDSISPPNWVDRLTVPANAQGVFEYVDPPPLPPMRFYRSVSP